MNKEQARTRSRHEQGAGTRSRQENKEQVGKQGAGRKTRSRQKHGAGRNKV
jgi:hypothetical protein